LHTFKTSCKNRIVRFRLMLGSRPVGGETCRRLNA
jgi:hypothetical protein